MGEDRETERRGRGPDSTRDGGGEGGALKAHARCYPQPGARWRGTGVGRRRYWEAARIN